MDLKHIVAYSSVAHMGLVTLILFSHTVQGLVAAVFNVSTRFSKFFIYSRYFFVPAASHSLVRYYRGMVIPMPLFGTLMLTLVLANAVIPLSCNFVGEFFSLLGVFEYSYVVGVIASFGSLIGSLLYLFV